MRCKIVAVLIHVGHLKGLNIWWPTFLHWWPIVKTKKCSLLQLLHCCILCKSLGCWWCLLLVRNFRILPRGYIHYLGQVHQQPGHGAHHGGGEGDQEPEEGALAVGQLLPAGAAARHALPLAQGDCIIELETKVKRCFAKASKVSYSHPSLMIIA